MASLQVLSPVHNPTQTRVQLRRRGLAFKDAARPQKNRITSSAKEQSSVWKPGCLDANLRSPIHTNVAETLLCPPRKRLSVGAAPEANERQYLLKNTESLRPHGARLQPSGRTILRLNQWPIQIHASC